MNPARTSLIGVDEAGRGPLAGPVVCAAVVLPDDHGIEGLDDSKRLTEVERDALAPRIQQRALAFAVIEVSAARIDQINIFQATMEGMRLAIEAVQKLAHGQDLSLEKALIDGNKLPKQLNIAAQSIVKGDQKEACIAAASILAKTHRDALLTAMEMRFPGYGFAQHKGYPTPQHLKALQELGVTSEHRRTYAPVKRYLQGDLF